MFPTLLCPSCKAQTPDDGRFCDQCGGALRRCPTCGKVSAGAFCPEDRTPLDGAGPTVATPRLTVPPPAPRPAAPQPAAPPAPQPAAAQPDPNGGTRRGDPVPLRLRLTALNVSLAPLDVEPGELLGRAVGRYAAALAPMHAHGVSSRHARLDRSPTGWTITDIGSSYGIDVRSDNVWPTPERVLPRDVPHPLAPASYVRMGDVIFQVGVPDGPARPQRPS
jgi:hypothetical protein